MLFGVGVKGIAQMKEKSKNVRELRMLEIVMDDGASELGKRVRLEGDWKTRRTGGTRW